MATFMKGDTFLEVASCLARTDIHDAALCNFALEVVKRYVRSKIKKGKGKEVGGPKGKLEELERKYAHLGYQDIFYLTRLQLGLPPSTLDLGRPTSPCRRVLVRAKFPLDPKYQLPLEDPSTTRLSAAMSRSGGGASGSGSTFQQGAGYAESSRSAASGSRTALGGPDVLRRPLMDREDSRGRSRERRDTNMRSPALGPTPMIVVPTPPEGRRESETLPRTPEALPIPGRSPLHQAETRDLFDHSVDLGTPLPPPFLGGHGRTQMDTPPVPLPKRAARDEQVQEDDVDVRRMLEARIQALTTALKSLDASKSSTELHIPAAATAAPVAAAEAPPPPRAPLLRVPSGSRRRLPPASPPPDVPLPPLPTDIPSTRPAPTLATSSPRLRLNGTPPPLTPSPSTPISSPTAIPSTVLDMHVRDTVNSAVRPTAPTTSPGNEGIFELDPEIAKDPFGSPTQQRSTAASVPRLVKPAPLYSGDGQPVAVPALPTASSKNSHGRAGRETAAFARSQDDLRRVRAMNGYGNGHNGRQTPPPQYER